MSIKIPLFQSQSFIRIFKYGITGLLNNGLGYCLYLLGTYMGLQPKLAVTILYGVGATISFFVNKKFTFAHHGNHLSSGAKYILVQLGGYSLNLFLLIVFSEYLGYPHQFVQAISIFVVAAYLYLCFSLFVFAQKKEALQIF